MVFIYLLFGYHCVKSTLNAESHFDLACNSSVSPAGGDIVIQISRTVVSDANVNPGHVFSFRIFPEQCGSLLDIWL